VKSELKEELREAVRKKFQKADAGSDPRTKSRKSKKRRKDLETRTENVIAAEAEAIGKLWRKVAFKDKRRAFGGSRRA